MAKNLANFYYNLAVMTEAGMPIMRSVETAAKSCRGRLKSAVSDIYQDISAGNPLSEGMKKFPEIFPNFDIAAVDAADRSGSLPEVLRLLAEWHEFSSGIKANIVSGLGLPIFVLLLAAVVAPLPFFVFGRYTLVQAIIESAGILAIFIIPALVILAILKYLPQTGSARKFVDSAVLWVPYLGKAIKHYSVSSFCFTFHILYQAAMPITDCVELALKSTMNTAVAERLRGGMDSAAQGRSIAEGFKSPYIDGFVESWAMGEESGQLDSVTKKMAEVNKDEALYYFTRFGYWLPKVIYAFVCLMIIYLIFRNASMLTSFYTM